MVNTSYTLRRWLQAKEVWILLLQSALLGKVREAYSALSVDQSSEYDTVKSAVRRPTDRSLGTAGRMTPRLMLSLHNLRRHYLTVGVYPRKFRRNLAN